MNRTDFTNRPRGFPESGFNQRAGYRRDSRDGFLQKINFNAVSKGLIFATLGLGLFEALAPKRFQKLIGVRCGDHSKTIRAMGFREIGQALLMLISGRSPVGTWSRVAGDVVDLSLLGAAYTTPGVKKGRLTAAAASALGISALDVLTATQLSRQETIQEPVGMLTKEDLNHRARSGAFNVTRSITINAPPNELYQFWRNFENLSRFMYHLKEVHVIDSRRSHWVARAPAGMQVEWDAEIIEDQADRRIAWRSMPDADVPNSGQVNFIPGPEGRGTVVRVQLEYRPPAGALGRVIAKLFGESPSQQVAGDLNRFKQVIETGEILVSEGSPSGYGQKMQRPARPMKDKNIEHMPRIENERRNEEEYARRLRDRNTTRDTRY
jgi:uncharacterized membrane protein